MTRPSKHDSATLTLYGANWCGDCRRAKKFLGERRIPYRWVDITDNAEAIATVESHNDGKRRIPTLVFDDGDVLSNPDNATLAERLGLRTKASMQFYDAIIVGSGPAGLTAALYLARDGFEMLVIERGGLGGQAGITDRLDNFPGFPEGITGDAFADRLVQQARRFGVEILETQAVETIRTDGPSRFVETSDGAVYGARTVLAATGARYRRLGVEGEDDLISAGIHFCATCDGPFYRDQHVVVVGGGQSAAEESLFLTRFAEQVTLLVRGEQLKAPGIIRDKIEQESKIEVRYGVEVKAFEGEDSLQQVVFSHRDSGDQERLDAAAAFIFIGLDPNGDWLPDVVQRDGGGFVCTNRTLETSMPGLFAAGDLRAGATHQAASAAGEGATVALMMREYLNAT